MSEEHDQKWECKIKTIYKKSDYDNLSLEETRSKLYEFALDNTFLKEQNEALKKEVEPNYQWQKDQIIHAEMLRLGMEDRWGVTPTLDEFVKRAPVSYGAEYDHRNQMQLEIDALNKQIAELKAELKEARNQVRERADSRRLIVEGHKLLEEKLKKRIEELETEIKRLRSVVSKQNKGADEIRANIRQAAIALGIDEDASGVEIFEAMRSAMGRAEKADAVNKTLLAELEKLRKVHPADKVELDEVLNLRTLERCALIHYVRLCEHTIEELSSKRPEYLMRPVPSDEQIIEHALELYAKRSKGGNHGK
jgi:archaellum component FlaC